MQDSGNHHAGSLLGSDLLAIYPIVFLPFEDFQSRLIYSCIFFSYHIPLARENEYLLY